MSAVTDNFVLFVIVLIGVYGLVTMAFAPLFYINTNTNLTSYSVNVTWNETTATTTQMDNPIDWFDTFIAFHINYFWFDALFVTVCIPFMTYIGLKMIRRVS
jgi:hypothetical protein